MGVGVLNITVSLYSFEGLRLIPSALSNDLNFVPSRMVFNITSRSRRKRILPGSHGMGVGVDCRLLTPLHTGFGSAQGLDPPGLGQVGREGRRENLEFVFFNKHAHRH